MHNVRPALVIAAVLATAAWSRVTGPLVEGWRILTIDGGAVQLSSPFGVAVDDREQLYLADTGNARIVKLSAAGSVYVADTFNHRIQKLSPSGELLAQWGEQGTEVGQFRFPSGVAVDRRGNIYVADTGNHRVQKLTVGQ
jgi:tripartite motif-containing protein 71